MWVFLSPLPSAGGVIGFDINKTKIAELQKGFDRTGEVSTADFQASDVQYTSEPTDLKAADFIIVAVPTPINEALQPDLKALRMVSELIGNNMSPGTIVVYESTVYPGVTEDICLPILGKASGLKSGADFKVGYSPERINPRGQGAYSREDRQSRFGSRCGFA